MVRKIQRQVITKFFIPIFLILTLFLILNTAAAAYGDIYVNGTGGNDSNDGSSWNKAKATIQNGTESVTPNATVYVANGTYNEHLNITKNLNLVGQSQNDTIIDGTHSGTVININPGLIVGISNFTIKNGYATYGGGIYNSGTLTINDCTIAQNTAPQHDGYGGGIYNTGNLTIKDSTFTNNIIWYYGGAIYNSGICNIVGSTFSPNTAVGQGGAIYNPGNLTVSNSTFTGNTASTYGSSGAIHNKGNLNVSNSTFTGNTAVVDAGAIYNELGGNAIIINANFTHNTATREGGAIDNKGNLTVSDSIFTGNNANAYGGAINNIGNLTVTGSIFINNTALDAGAIDNFGGTTNAHFNTFMGNTYYDVVQDGGTVNAQNNWWYTNIDPVTAGKIYGGISTPWVVLSINAFPNTINIGENSTVSVNLNYNSNNENMLTVYGKIFPDLNVLFNCDNLGSLNPTNSTVRNGLNSTTIFKAGYTPGFAMVNVTFDNQKVNTTIRIIDRNNIYVATNGNDSTGNGSPTNPFQTIAKAIAEVQANGTIHILNGEYKGSGNKNIHINKDLTITGQNQTSTIINAEGVGFIFTIDIGKNVTLQNLTLKNGFIYGNGGAINNQGNLTVVNCTFTGNTHGNTASYGGAIYNSGNCNIMASTFTNNLAWDYGGAIYNSGTVTMHFNRITGNTANAGSAIYNSMGTVDAANNWWGYNADPKTIPNTIAGNVNNVITTPWLQIPPSSILIPGKPDDYEPEELIESKISTEEPKIPTESVDVAAGTIPIKGTGLPLAYVVLAVLLLLAGLILPKR